MTDPTISEQIEVVLDAALRANLPSNKRALRAAAATLRKVRAGEYVLVRKLIDEVDDKMEPLV